MQRELFNDDAHLLRVTGGNLADRASRRDIDTGRRRLGPADITGGPQSMVAADRPVHVRSISGDELRARPERVRTMSSARPWTCRSCA